MKVFKKYDWENLILDYACREELIDTICECHPSVKKKTLSKSLCGRDINYLEIGNQDNPVLFAGAFHGMEWLTSLLLLKFSAKLGNALENSDYISEIDISNFLRKRGIVIIPCMNPDGVEISLHGADTAGRFKELVQIVSKGDTEHWQANARGVDINHNFNVSWEELHERERNLGIYGAAPTRYGGRYPESEPETKALTGFCRERCFSHAIAFHSQGQEIYWRYGDFIPERSELMAKVMAISSGYKLSVPEQIATGGGFTDWFISCMKKPGFTVEIGLGKNPLPVSDLEQIYTDLEEMMILSIIM